MKGRCRNANRADIMRVLEIHMTRPAGKGDDVTDVFDTGRKADKALEAQAKARVRYGAISSQVQVWLIVLLLEPVVSQPLLQHLHSRFKPRILCLVTFLLLIFYHLRSSGYSPHVNALSQQLATGCGSSTLGLLFLPASAPRVGCRL